VSDVSLDTYLQLLEDGAAFYLATRDAENLPDVAVLAGATRGPEPGTLTVYMAEGWTQTIANLGDNGRAAVTVARLADYRTFQLKGVCLGVRAAREDERPTIARQHDAFARAADFEQLGHVVRSWSYWPSVAIDIRVEQVFAQTPGPGTGQRVSA
jgi:hypothetical protein